MDYYASKIDNESSFEKFFDLMEKGMNPDIDPCEDFLGYACGGTNEENYNHDSNIFEKLLENDAINDSSLIRKAHDFYNSLPTDPVTVLQDDGVIEFCGGFPAFNENWTSENFNWIKAAAILSAVQLDTLLICSVRYLDNRKIINVTYKTPIDIEFKNIEETLRKLEISEEKIWDIINDVNTLLEEFNRISNYTITDGLDDYRIRKLFSELREDPFDYQTYFESFLGHPLNDDDIFHLDSFQPGYLDRFLNVFAEASPRAVANFIALRALQYGEVLGASYLRRMLTLRHFAPIFLAVSYKYYWNQAEHDNRRYVTKILKDSLEGYEKPVHDPEAIALILNRDERVLEFINSNFHYQKIEEEYDGLEINSANFFPNIINIGRHGIPVSLRKCHSYREEEQDLYIASRTFLDFFLNCHDKPLLYYFSGWNVDTWESICDCLIGEDIDDIEVRLPFESFDNIERCIQQQLKLIEPSEEVEESKERSEDLEELEKSIESLEDLEELEENYRMYLYIRAIIKLRQSYENYSTWLNENEDEARKQDQILERLNLNSRKAFFVSFIQRNCYKEDEDECQTAEILAILNCEEFAKEFQCKSDSLMNPKDKCKLKWSIS